MQMGRWFGFRPGYRDLVRLYVGRSDGINAYDIYLAFEAACRSEETFREEIKRYAELVDGKPQSRRPRDSASGLPTRPMASTGSTDQAVQR